MLRSFLAASISVLCAHAHADILHVPSEYPTIAAAIEAATHDDEIHIAPGVYRELLEPGLKSVHLVGTGPGQVILSGDHDLDGESDSVILRYSGTPDDLYYNITLENLTFVDAISAVKAERVASLIVRDCEFVNNEVGIDVGFGIPIAQVNSSLDTTIERCTFRDGEKGIWIDNGHNLRVLDCRFNNQSSVSVNAVVDSAEIDRVRVKESTRASILIRSEDVLISNCLFENNTSSYADQNFGGASCLAIRSDGTSLITDCEFRKCHEGSSTVSFETTSNDAVFRNCKFLGNITRFETTLDITGTVELLDCDFADNSSREVGPINFFSGNEGVSRISGCMFTNNIQNKAYDDFTYHGAGGALCLESGHLLIEDSVFHGNLAGEAGALMIMDLRGSCIVRRSSFYGNKAVRNGFSTEALGGVVSCGSTRSGAPIAFVNCVLVGNEALGGKGGIVNSANTVLFVNSILMDNESEEGRAVYLYRTPANTGNTFRFGLSNCVIVDSSPSQLFESPAGAIDPDWAPNMIVSDPGSIGFTRLPDDGGDGWGDDPETDLVNESLNDDFGDLRLRPDSVLIDAGTNTDLIPDLSDFDLDGDLTETLIGLTDIDGNPRFTDTLGMPDLYPAGGYDGPIDLGAYEFQGVSCLADVNQDGMLSPTDFIAWINAFNTSGPGADQNRDGDITPTDFNAWVANFNTGC